MHKKDISLLVLNSIKDSKTLLDNYGYFFHEDSEGILQETAESSRYLFAFEKYYSSQGADALDTILSSLHYRYEPYILPFQGETWDMNRAKRITDIMFPGAAISIVLTAFVSDFFPIALTMGTFSLISYLYVKTRTMQRAKVHKSLQKLDEEAKSIKIHELSEVLNEERKPILEALAMDYTYKSED